MKYKLILSETKKQVLLKEYREYIQQLIPYMQKQIGFNKPPIINFLEDEENAQNPFGRTAHYDPQNMEISVYVTGRHAKDIMRSIAHEVIHHAQNCRGDLSLDKVGKVGKGYAQSNPHLRNMEKEAYLLGNMIFRDWEDKHKYLFGNMMFRDWEDNYKKGLNEMKKQLNEKHCDHKKVHGGMTHEEYVYKRDDNAKEEEQTLEEWKNDELFGLLMKKFNIVVSEKKKVKNPGPYIKGKRSKIGIDDDGDGVPNRADKKPLDGSKK
jgi:hypothetical protein